jgi:hypothetical protein
MSKVEEVSAEQVEQHYKAMGDSARLVNAGQPEGMSDEDWAGTKSRNQEHLKLMLDKEFWTDEDMSAIEKASVA